MSAANGDQIGDRLGMLRRRHGLTQEGLAERSGVDVSTVRKLEQGARSGGRLATLHALARALGVHTSDLFNPGVPAPVDDDAHKIDLIRIRQVLAPALEGEPGDVDPESLADRLARAEDLHKTTQYTMVARELPDLLIEARRGSRGLDGDAQERASELLCRALHLAGSLLTQLRQYDLAYFPLRESADIARDWGQELTAASVMCNLSWLLIRQGRFAETVRLASETADAVEPRMSRASTAEVATWGWLLLHGSAAAIRNNDPDQATSMLGLAETGAANTRATERDGWGTFASRLNQTVVARRRAEYALVRGNPREALGLADSITHTDAPTAVNRNRHLLDVASAHVAQRDYTDAFEVLHSIRHTVPEWLRHQSYARDIMRGILDRRARPVTEDMRELADFLTIDG